MSKFVGWVATMTVAAFASIGAAAADTNILFILDASGSMYGKVGDEAKIVVAKRELRNLLAELPDDAQVGLMTYGATSKSSCGDIQLLSPVGAASDPGSAIEKITPLGKTPIAAALQQSARAFSGLEGQNNNVVLISDGIESCDGDPCAAATALVASGIGVRVNVVGFGLTDEESAALKCIADNGNGKYFSAKDTAGFSDAIKQVVDVAETAASSEPPPAEPPQPVENVVFDDSFEGSALNADTWLVTNANEDAYLVEDGSLLAVSSTPGGVANADIPNIFKYVGTLPDGDYTVTTTLRMEFATGKEQFQLGLFDDGSNYLTASVVANANCCNSTINLKLDKVAGGQATGFDLIAIRLPSADEFSKEANATEQPITLSFIKQGHTFRASVTFVGLKDDAGNQVVVTTDPVTSLRPPKSLVMNLSQAAAVDGETTAYVDEVKITTTK